MNTLTENCLQYLIVYKGTPKNYKINLVLKPKRDDSLPKNKNCPLRKSNLCMQIELQVTGVTE